MAILDKLKLSGFEALTDSDILELLTAEGNAQKELFQLARDVRHENNCDDVLLRGVIEISNICSKSCDYCAMRSTNKELSRYAMNVDEIITLAQLIKDSGIWTVFLQGGQNPNIDSLVEKVIPIIKNDLGMEVLLCLGERTQETYEKFVQLGANSYIIKFESSDPDLYMKIAHAPLENRLNAIRWAKSAGLKLGTGNIVGIPGQSMQSLVNDIRLGISIKPDFISSSPFIPNPGTPMEQHTHGSINMTLNTMATLRIAMKTPTIPAVSALESLQKGGQQRGLEAGANVLTINFTPKETQSMYKIYSERRFVVSMQHAQQIVEGAGLRIREFSSLSWIPQESNSVVCQFTKRS